MRNASILIHSVPAGILTEYEKNSDYGFRYLENYKGDAISLTMPVRSEEYRFDSFPPFFDGLLPEGIMLEGLLRERKIDKSDCFSQLIAVGKDLVGAVTVEGIDDPLPY